MASAPARATARFPCSSVRVMVIWHSTTMSSTRSISRAAVRQMGPLSRRALSKMEPTASGKSTASSGESSPIHSLALSGTPRSNSSRPNCSACSCVTSMAAAGSASSARTSKISISRRTLSPQHLL